MGIPSWGALFFCANKIANKIANKCVQNLANHFNGIENISIH